MKPAPPVTSKLRLIGMHGERTVIGALDQINLERRSASRYFWRQFFASLNQWIGARNPV